MILAACTGVYSDPGSIGNLGHGPKQVFVTSTVYQGGLLGGLTGADKKCEDRATAVGLEGTYKAWLSDETTAARDRLTHSTGKYILVDGTMVAASWYDLLSGTLGHAIDMDEAGQPYTAASACAVVGGLIPAWTGTTYDGQYEPSADHSCQGWTALQTGGLMGNGVVGSTKATDSRWTMSNCAQSCDFSAPVYCLEQ